MSVLFDHRDEFDERNAFLQVALGLLSCAREVSKVRPRLEASLSGPRAEEPLDATMCFLLGLASVSRTIEGHAETAATQALDTMARPEPQGTRAEAPSLRSLLEL